MMQNERGRCGCGPHLLRVLAPSAKSFARIGFMCGAGLFLSGAAAHHPLPDLVGALKGTRLCIDTDAVREAGGGGTTGSDPVDGDLLQQVHRELVNVLDAYDVAHERASDCEASSPRVGMSLEARYLDPSTYRNFPAQTYSIQVSLAVENGDESEGITFLSGISDLHSEAESATPVRRRLLAESRTSIVQLAEAWRADQSGTWTRRLRTLGLPLLIAVAGSLGVIAYVRSSRRSRRSLHDRQG